MVKKRKCVECEKEDYIFSKGRCKFCAQVAYAKKAQEKKKVKKVKKVKEDLPEAKRLIKKANKIRKYSLKRQKIESELKKVKAELFENWNKLCQGCGTGIGYIDLSHRLPREPYVSLIADPNNLDWYCRERCHPAVERGDYHLLLNGAEVIEYIKSKDITFFNEKTILKAG